MLRGHMTSDNEIYQSIGEILLAIAPEHATVVYLDAQVSPEGDHGKMLFDYDIEGGDTQWFTPESGRVSRDLLLQLVKLRAFLRRTICSSKASLERVPDQAGSTDG